jgi:hypothetical protein
MGWALRDWPIPPTVLLLVAALGASTWWHAAAGSANGWQASLDPPLPIFRPAPEWQNGPVPCRSDPLAHLPSPTSVDVLRACAAVSGVVRSIDRDPHTQNVEISIQPDAPVARLLDPSVQLYVRADILPTDQASVGLPSVDQHATFFGSWVVNRRAAVRGTLELRPTWGITSARIAGPVDPRPRLAVSGRLPRAVPVGSLVQLSASVTAGGPAPARPVSQATVFVELRAANGQTQRWEATRSNSLGHATISFAAIEVPGTYTVWLYASKGRDIGTAQLPVEIIRRTG